MTRASLVDQGRRSSAWWSRRARAALVCACCVSVLAVGACTTATRPVPATPSDTEADAPIDTLRLLREAADHEALFTLVGGLKPMSTGIWRGDFAVHDPDLSDLRAVREALEPLRNDLWYADVQVFDDIYEGERAVHAFVIHRRSFAAMIERYAGFWSAWGITPGTHPSEVLAVVDRMERADRWRGYGYLFGYPSEHVDFFVEAGLAAAEGGEVGPGRDRRFVQIPTYAAPTGRFTYAVALDAELSLDDEALAEGARRILAAYAERREEMTSVHTMIRELRRLDRRFGSEVASTGRRAAKSEQAPTGAGACCGSTSG